MPELLQLFAGTEEWWRLVEMFSIGWNMCNDWLKNVFIFRHHELYWHRWHYQCHQHHRHYQHWSSLRLLMWLIEWLSNPLSYDLITNVKSTSSAAFKKVHFSESLGSATDSSSSGVSCHVADVVVVKHYVVIFCLFKSINFTSTFRSLACLKTNQGSRNARLPRSQPIKIFLHLSHLSGLTWVLKTLQNWSACSLLEAKRRRCFCKEIQNLKVLCFGADDFHPPQETWKSSPILISFPRSFFIGIFRQFGILGPAILSSQVCLQNHRGFGPVDVPPRVFLQLLRVDIKAIWLSYC